MLRLSLLPIPLIVSLLISLLPSVVPDGAMATDTPSPRAGRFAQEVPHAYGTADGLPSEDILAIRIDDGGSVRAVTASGAAVWTGAGWRPVPSEPRDAHRDIVVRGDVRFLATDAGLVAEKGGDRLRLIGGGPARQLALSPGGRLLVAAASGLWEERPDGTFARRVADDGRGRHWAATDVLGVAFDAGGRLWFATRAGVGCRTESGWRLHSGRDGLPYADVTVIRAGRAGDVWFGTRLGAVRLGPEGWAYRQGPGWLPGDEVRDIAIGEDGDVWFATDRGVGRLERRPMTLAEKAEHYEDEIDRCVRRTPFGYVSSVRLAAPGDRSRVHRPGDDNDGLWTAMYGAGQCFAWAATRRASARRRAREAFEALRFLQEVTRGGDPAPPAGFVARSILPTTGPDPNRGSPERDLRHRREVDGMWKVLRPRWPRSADGKWYFKADTSSDELDGHYFFYPLYHDLVADTPAERDRVRAVVRSLTDHLIEHGYRLVDHDGLPTRWAVYDPDSLNRDDRWRVERGLNSLSILSYLAVAAHVTGDPRYTEHEQELAYRHGYAANLMATKLHLGIGSGNQSDDEMAFMCFYNLLKYTRDEGIRRRALVTFHEYWCLVRPERNPFFHFAYAAFGRGAVHRDGWGARRLDPDDGWLADSVATLRGFPLDLVNWPRRNSHRLDVTRLGPKRGIDPGRAERRARGHLRDGKVLPIENRWVQQWNTDPWQLDYPGDGRTLAPGTPFLLACYMGLYHGFVTE